MGRHASTVFNSAAWSFVIVLLAFTSCVPTGSDTTAPSISIDEPADASATSDTTPSIVVTFADEAGGSGIDTSTLSVIVDGAKQTVDCVPAEGSATCTLSEALSVGSHTLTATIRDVAGNEGTDTSTFEVQQMGADGTPPAVGLVSPADGSTTDQTPTLVLSVRDEDGGSGVDESTLVVLVDGTDISGSCTFAGDEVSCTTAELSAGTHTIDVTVSDVTGNVKTIQFTFDVIVSLTVNLSEPQSDLLTNADTVTVSGDAAGASSLTINGQTVTLGGGSFSVELDLHEGVNTFTAVAEGASGATGSASVRVTRDTTPPSVFIDGPGDGGTVSGDTITVTGTVADVVIGPVNNSNCSVRIRSRSGFFDADIANGTFVAENIPLLNGLNAISAVATDALGNEGLPVTISVTRQDAVGQRLVIMGGANQTGVVGQMLSNAVTVKASDVNDIGLAGRRVSFTVKKNNGSLDQNGASLVTVVTDANGEAAVDWEMGMRAGRANNRLEVSAPGFAVLTVCASAANADCSMLVADGGENQTGIAGQPLAQPFVAAALDSGGNRCADQPVTFSVVEGGGQFSNGSASIEVATGAGGFATATLTLGSVSGFNNNVIRVTTPGGGTPVTFLASATAPDMNADTTFRGTVLDTTNEPVVGAVVHIHGEETSVTTDESGGFTLPGVPIGNQFLIINGTIIGNEDAVGQIPLVDVTYPAIELVIDVLPNVENSLGRPIFLPRLDSSATATVGSFDATLRMGGVSGMELTIFANSATFPSGLREGTMSVTQVSNDQVPMPPSGGAAPPWVGTLQPPGVHFDPPVQVTAPNSLGLAIGSIVDMFSFNHELAMFINIGTGTVQPDGATIVSDPGSGITVSGWFFDCPPPPPTGEAENNDDPLTDDTVKEQFKDAWTDSNPGENADPSRQEHGGWIVRNEDGSFGVERWPMGRAAGITPTALPDNAVGGFHTHPNLGPRWQASPSDADIAWVRANPDRAPFFAISENRIYRVNRDGSVDDVSPRDPC